MTPAGGMRVELKRRDVVRLLQVVRTREQVFLVLPRWRALWCRFTRHRPVDLTGCCPRCGRLLVFLFGGFA